VGLFFPPSFRLFSFPREPLVGSVLLQPQFPTPADRGSCGEKKGWMDSDWEACGSDGRQQAWWCPR